MVRSDEDRLYEEHVLRHYEEPYHRGTLADATHRHRIENPVCGDAVQIELRVGEASIVQQACFNGCGCIISQAAASMLTEYIEGKSITDLRALTARGMLDLFRARITPRRQRCCLLAWQALRGTLEFPSQQLWNANPPVDLA